jgi:hypothetical protein
LSGYVEIVNYEPKVKPNYDWGFRLEILGYGWDEKLPGSGRIGASNLLYVPETINLNVDRTGAPRGEEHTMLGTVWLNAYTRVTESWQANFTVDFDHNPQSIVGIGPTKNGETFSTDFYSNPGKTWESLLITDTSYDEVLWYVQAPGDTNPGTYIEVDSGGVGEITKATMSYTFPEDVEGAYKIRAEIWRNDGTSYWQYYTVWVSD